MVENNDIAVIFKRVYEDNMIEYIPYKVVEGHLDLEEEVFIDKNGNLYFHMIENMPGNCFGIRNEIGRLSSLNPKLSLAEIKKELLKDIKDSKYFLAKDEDENYFILTQDKKNKKI